MKYWLAFMLFSAGCIPAFSQRQTAVARPKLVVGIVVDQMRWDYLYRYYDRYSQGGFKRLMNDGFSCENAMINYLPSFTGPGHACVYTGSVPAIHGIASNDWWDRKLKKAVYCAEDKSVNPVGGSAKAGRMSPRNMLTTTVTDELRLATNMKSKVYGIAIKDRGSILPAGHLANGAYWFDDSTGNFISSDYYGNALPDWLVKFNAKRYADSMVAKDWDLLYPAQTYTQSLADNNAYEGKFTGEDAPVFPHSIAGIKDKGYLGLRYLPAGNTLVFRLAKACVKGAALGQGYNTDFLCVSFSSPDYAGHKFTPNSMEMEDMLLRLDQDLESFLNYLDKHVGEGNYTVLLTADHGGAHNPQYLQDIKVPAGNLYEPKLTPVLNNHLKAMFGKDSLVKYIYDYRVYTDDDHIVRHKLKVPEVRNAIIGFLRDQEGIAYVADLHDMAGSIIPEPIKTMMVNGYHPDRSGTIQLVYKPGWFSDDIPTGTTHGTWNPYDTHIPLLWYGWGIKKGVSNRTVNMTDIAPTLAALLHIQMPNGNVGHVIEELIEKDR